MKLYYNMYATYIIIFSCIYFLDVTSRRITTKPSPSKYKYQLPLFWKIANKNDISAVRPKRYVFDNYPIAIYKDKEDTIRAVSDICIHRGASLSQGKMLNNNCLQCPYHGWEYKNGLLNNVPGSPNIRPNTCGIPRFEVQVLNNDVYVRPTYDVNSQKGNIFNHTIYIPPEADDDSFVRVSGSRHIKRPNNIITENVLDMMHISYVHSFGNSLAPIPFDVEYEDIDDVSGRTTFHYTAGPSSMSKLIGGAKYVQVENEFHLPDVTVTRVKAKNIVKTIVTHCYPVGKNESILHFDLYRNFLTTSVLDPLFEFQMKITLDEDVTILNRIYDDYILGFMSSKYDITQTKYREKVNRINKRLEDTDQT